MTQQSRIFQFDVLGSFDFYTSVVSLDAIQWDEFQSLSRMLGPPAPGRRFSVAQFMAADRVFPLLAHELTHFIDATSTCWGLHHLHLLDQAYRARAAQSEWEFHHLNTLYDHIRTLRLPAYYRLVAEHKPVQRQWAYDVTMGRRFTSSGNVRDARPIAFCRFATPRGEMLARAPLSPVSLFETSAMAQELQQRMAFLDLIETPGEQRIELARQSTIALDHLYDHRITEYSVCAHLIANYQQCSDVIRGYSLAGVVSRLVLNIAPASFALIAQQADPAELLSAPHDHEFVQRIREGLRAADHGVLYFLLCRAMPPLSYETDAAIQAGVERALTMLGITLSQVRDHSRAEVERLLQSIDNSPSVILRQLAHAGVQNHQRIAPLQTWLRFEELHLPPVLFGDMSAHMTYGRSDNLLVNLDPDACFDDLYSLASAVNNFADACV